MCLTSLPFLKCTTKRWIVAFEFVQWFPVSSIKMANSEDYLYKKIIVIGAGISGLACASHLRDFGFKNVLILEAKEYIGGRIHTSCPLESSDLSKEPAYNFIELGAQWIHGKEGNAVYELAHSKGLVNESAPSYNDALYDCKLNNTEEEREAIKAVIEYLDEKIDNSSENLNEDISVLEFINTEFSNYIQPYINMIELLKGALDWYCNFHCELSGCTSLSSVSLRLLNQYKVCEGPQNIELKYGYSSLINVLHEKVPDDTILRSTEVKVIDWTALKNQESEKKVEKSESKCNCSNGLHGPKVKVICNNGEEYEADHVIITMPLGYLKNNVDSIFVPSLPQEKITAIQSVGFGTVNKVYLEFSEPFWEASDIYNVMWTSSLYEIFGEELDEVSSQWIFYINRFAYTSGHPNMLCAWIVGEGAIDMEKIPEDEVSFACMTLLEKIVGKELPKPLRIIRSTWHSDPHICGSYSYLSMESTEESNLQIAQPIFSDICPSKHLVLQFAGEATHPTYFSTVHGAYETGHREAQRLFDYYRYK